MLLDFEELATTRFEDPIFDGVYQKEWIDHVLYTRNKPNWVANAKIHKSLSQGVLTRPPYQHSSDHFPLTVEITL